MRLSQDLKPLVDKTVRVKKQAEKLGIFTNDRELLECDACDLIEDVTIEGFLITYHESSADRRDTGRRFIKVDEETYRCPACGTIVKAVIL